MNYSYEKDNELTTKLKIKKTLEAEILEGKYRPRQ